MLRLRFAYSTCGGSKVSIKDDAAERMKAVANLLDQALAQGVEAGLSVEDMAEELRIRPRTLRSFIHTRSQP